MEQLKKHCKTLIKECVKQYPNLSWNEKFIQIFLGMDKITLQVCSTNNQMLAQAEITQELNGDLSMSCIDFDTCI